VPRVRNESPLILLLSGNRTEVIDILAAEVDAYLFTRIPGDDHRRRLNANEPPRERRASDVAGGAPGLFPVTRGIRDVRDSKIEIVRAAALVLEPWVTAAPSNPAGPFSRPRALYPWRRPFLPLAEVISIVETCSL